MNTPTINCLDHGFVRLVEHMGSDLSIVRAARVSYNAAWRAGDNAGSDARLINYLMKNNHTSPFEACQLTFEVKAPIFNFRQWHRHRTWAFSEVSARYSELPEEFYVPEVQVIGTQSKDNKQARDIEELLAEEGSRAMRISDFIWMASKSAFKTYRELLKLECPRELARSVLPVNTYSHMFASVSLHNLFRFLKLRLHPHAQYEIRVYAEAMLQLITPLFPVATAAFKQHQLGASDGNGSKGSGGSTSTAG